MGPPAHDKDEELTLNQVCQRLKRSRYYVYDLINSGKLRARREGKEYRILESDLKAYIQGTFIPGSTSDGK
jgi:excisionase family DNA binding protein